MTHPYPPGTRIVKLAGGAAGRVVEQLGHNEETGVYGYMVVWDDAPGVKCFTTSARIEAEERAAGA